PFRGVRGRIGQAPLVQGNRLRGRIVDLDPVGEVPVFVADRGFVVRHEFGNHRRRGERMQQGKGGESTEKVPEHEGWTTETNYPWRFFQWRQPAIARAEGTVFPLLRRPRSIEAAASDMGGDFF